MIQTVNVNVAAQPTSGGPESFLVLSQNENGRQIRFRILGDDLPAGCTATFSGTKPDGNVYSASGTIDGNFVLLDEEIQMTAVAGRWDAKLSIAKGTENIMTSLIRVTVVADAVSGDAIPSSSELDGIVAECRSYAEAAKNEAYGSPLTASTAAAMTDQSRVYVYTGSESGMTAGHWYYYNGSAWADGGVYNAVAVDTDTTLAIAGKAADAKKVGDELADVKEDLSDMNTATSVDVGKALKVKTVTDGKVSEWEFGEAGGGTVELDATLTDPTKAAQAKAVGDAVEKTVTAFEEAEYTGNVVDPSNASVSGQWVSNLRMASLDGTFYSNPLVMGLGFANAYPRDAEENNIPFAGSSATSVRIGDSNYIYKIEISGLTVIQTSYESLENLNSNVHKAKTTYTLSAIPDHWYISGKSLSGNVTSTNYGLTAEPSETYVVYAEPVINYGYRYADELDEHIGDVVNGELGGLLTATAEDVGRTPKVKTVADGKVTAWDLSDENHFEPSCNLIDESKIKWTPVGGYWTLEDGYYFPVTAGKKV